MSDSDHMRPAASRRIVLLAFRWLVPVLILAGFAISGHLADAVSALSDVSIVWSVPLVVVGMALPLSHAWRWCYLLKRTGAELPIAASARMTSLASLLNYAAPGFLGAPAKALFARDSHRIPISRSLPTLAVEQMLDAAMLFGAGLVAVLLAGPSMVAALGRDALSQLLFTLVVAIAGVSLLVIAVMLLRRLFPGFLIALRDATRTLIQSRQHRQPVMFLTGTRWLLDMLAVGIASVGVGLRLGLLEILLIANLSLLAGLIAPVPGGLGVREAVMASIAGVLGISVPAILALSILHRAGLAIGLPLVLAGSKAFEWSKR